MAKEENTNTEYPLSYAQEVTWPFWSFSFVPGFLLYFLPNLERLHFGGWRRHSGFTNFIFLKFT